MALSDETNGSASLETGAAKVQGAISNAASKTGGGGGGGSGGGDYDSELVRLVREVIVRHPVTRINDILPPDLLRDDKKVEKKAEQLQLFEAIGMLTSEEIRTGDLLRLFRHATHRDAKVWTPALWLLQDYFPEELEGVTRAFESEIAASKKVLEYEVRLFVARSPFASKDFLIEKSLRDMMVCRVALENLLRRRLLTDLNRVPANLYMNVAKSPLAHRRLRGELIFSEAEGGRVAVAALKKFLGNVGDEKIRKLILLAHQARRPIPSSVLFYVVRKLEPSKDELLSLVGLEAQWSDTGVDRVTEDIAEEIARGLAEKNPDLDKLSAKLPQRALKKRETGLLYGAMGADARGNAMVVNRPRSITPTVSADWKLLLEIVTKELIDRDLLAAEDLEELAMRNTDAAHFVLTKHPAVPVKHLLPILVRSKVFGMAAFRQLSNRIDRHPMFTWPELISWATRSGNPMVRTRVLERPEVLIEQLLYHLEKANEAIAKARAKAKGMGVGPDTFVITSGWEGVQEATLKGLLGQMPERIMSFTRIRMAIESERAGEIEKVLGSHELIYSAKPLSREEVDFEEEGLAGLTAEEMIAKLEEGNLDVSQKIALLCEGDDRVALATWNRLIDRENKRRPRLLSQQRAIAWALRSNSLGLKHKVIDEPKILVEHLLALLSYTIEELKTERDSARREKLTEIKVDTLSALTGKIPEKVASYLDVLPEIQSQTESHNWLGFDPKGLVDNSRAVVAPLLDEVRKI